MRRKWAAAWLIGILIGMAGIGAPVRSASAADLNLEIVFSTPSDETVTVSISSHGMLYLVTAVELAAGSTGTVFTIPEMEPAAYMLHLGKPSVEDIRNFEFTLDPDGTVTFSPSEEIQQEGNLIIVAP